jgi:hypothetical protein
MGYSSKESQDKWTLDAGTEAVKNHPQEQENLTNHADSVDE